MTVTYELQSRSPPSNIAPWEDSRIRMDCSGSAVMKKQSSALRLRCVALEGKGRRAYPARGRIPALARAARTASHRIEKRLQNLRLSL